MTIPVDIFDKPISDAARIVRARLPRHAFDLDELVQIGWEKVLRYLSGTEAVSTTLVFVAAKLAMLNAHDRWIRREWQKTAAGNTMRSGPAPRIEEWQEWLRCEPAPPIEALIDLYRALSRMHDEERRAWLATHVERMTLREAARLQSCKPHTVLARARRANERMIRAVTQ